jgi:hypothetical protein
VYLISTKKRETAVLLASEEAIVLLGTSPGSPFEQALLHGTNAIAVLRRRAAKRSIIGFQSDICRQLKR